MTCSRRIAPVSAAGTPDRAIPAGRISADRRYRLTETGTNAQSPGWDGPGSLR